MKNNQLKPQQITFIMVIFLSIFAISGCFKFKKKDVIADIECLLIDKKLHQDKSKPVLYQLNGSSCSASANLDESGNYFSDSNCINSVEYSAQSFRSFCKKHIADGYSYGDPRDWEQGIVATKPVVTAAKETKWRLAQGTQVNIFNVKSPDKMIFSKSVRYRTSGSCELSINIYKNNLADTNKKAAVYIHGGAWKYRGGSSDVVIDSISSALAEKGYIVFAPYYRLLKNSSDVRDDCKVNDGSEIQTDINQAINWIVTNGVSYGVAANELTNLVVMGNSAGAQLGANVLTTDARVKKGILAYGPYDFTFALNAYRDGLFTSSDAAWGVLSSFLNIAEDQLKVASTVNLPLVIDNTYTSSSKVNSLASKSIYLIHGTNDKIVPVEGSTRLCDALGGRTLSAQRYTGGQQLGTLCSTLSKEYIINSAGHGLELRCLSEDKFFSHLLKFYNVFTNKDLVFCPSGSTNNDTLVGNIYQEIFSAL